MVNSVNSGGYQAYSYQSATSAVQAPQRGGENRIETREAPAADSNRADSRELASNDRPVFGSSSNNNDRGGNLDVVV